MSKLNKLEIERLHVVLGVLFDNKIRTQFNASECSIESLDQGYLISNDNCSVWVPLNMVSYLALKK